MAVSPGAAAASADPTPWIAGLFSAGVRALQVREKQRSDRELLGWVLLARRHFPGPGLLFVNGRPDVALAGGADGVHLPARGLPLSPVRQAFRARLRVGRSTHTLAEVEAAAHAGADYVLFGPVWPTAGKTHPVGTGALREAASLGIPVYAVGGVTRQRLHEVAACGAFGAAAIRLFQEPERAAAAVREAARHFEHA